MNQSTKLIQKLKQRDCYDCRKLNHKEVVEEDRRNKEPKNEEARKRRAEYVLKVSNIREGKLIKT